MAKLAQYCCDPNHGGDTPIPLPNQLCEAECDKNYHFFGTCQQAVDKLARIKKAVA